MSLIISPSYRRHGFTLIELSIVLIIISLLIAGILAGMELIKQAKLRSLMSDMNSHQAATSAFLLQYNALPGDFSNATSFWSDALCDGDGDNGINSTGGNPCTPYAESSGFWQHLSLAGLIKGSYNGDGTAVEIGENMPITSFTGITFWPYKWSVEAFYMLGHDSGAYSAYPKINILNLGEGVGDIWPRDAFLQPIDALSIDKKYDDSYPGTGTLIGAPASGGCFTSALLADITTAGYDTTNTGLICKLGLKLMLN